MRKIVKAVLAISVFIILASGCKSKNSQPFASEIAQNWLEIKTKLNETDTAQALFPDVLTAQITDQLDEFNKKLNRFLKSPIGYIYQTHRRGEMRLLEITADINRLKNAV